MMKSLFLTSFTLTALLFAFFCPSFGSAATVDVFNNVCKGNATDSSVCKQATKTGNPLFGPEGVFTFAIKFMSVLVAVAAVIMIILAGLKLVTSGSNPQQVTKAREMIIYALAGILVAFFAQVIVRVFLNRIGA